MHEFSVMMQIVQEIIKEAEKSNLKSVEEVHLDIGKLTFLSFEQIKFCYEILSKDNILKNSKLIIKEKNAKVECEACGYVGDIKYENIGNSNELHFILPKFSCPKCDMPVKVLEGRECTITRIVGSID